MSDFHKTLLSMFFLTMMTMAGRLFPAFMVKLLLALFLLGHYNHPLSFQKNIINT